MHGAGNHLFWRDPNLALLGGTFQYHNFGGNVLYRFGGEGELYLGRFTLTGHAGYQTGEPNKSASTCVGQGAYALSDLRVYPIDDLMLRIGGGIAPLRQGQYQGIMRFGGEYQPTFGAFRSASFFVNSDIGSRNHHAVVVGLRLYFGLDGSFKPQPLITRHRQYDPEFLTSTALQGFRDCAPVVIERRPAPPTTIP